MQQKQKKERISLPFLRRTAWKRMGWLILKREKEAITIKEEIQKKQMLLVGLDLLTSY